MKNKALKTVANRQFGHDSDLMVRTGCFYTWYIFKPLLMILQLVYFTIISLPFCIGLLIVIETIYAIKSIKQ